MLNIPQELTAWKVSEEATNTKIRADGAHQCYLSIACKIRQSGAYLLGSASEYKTIYVPFGDTWEQGKRHIYTLIFGGGYTDQGEAVLNPIQFDAETTGWVDADKDVNVNPTLIQTFINIVPVGRLNIRKINPANGFFIGNRIFNILFDV